MSTTDPTEAQRLALATAEAATARAYDALLAVAPLDLTTPETALLVQARAAAGELHRRVADRRAEMVKAERAGWGREP